MYGNKKGKEKNPKSYNLRLGRNLVIREENWFEILVSNDFGINTWVLKTCVLRMD
jgi:hypothetical protein